VTNEVGASAEFASAGGAFERGLFRGRRGGGGRGSSFFGGLSGDRRLGDRWLDVAHKRVGGGGRVDGDGVHHRRSSGESERGGERAGEREWWRGKLEGAVLARGRENVERLVNTVLFFFFFFFSLCSAGAAGVAAG